MCRHLWDGSLLFHRGSGPVVHLDYRERTILQTFSVEGALKDGEELRAGFEIDEEDGRLLRWTSQGRILSGKCIGAGTDRRDHQGRPNLQLSTGGLNVGRKACFLDRGGNVAVIDWMSGEVTVLNTRPVGAAWEFSADDSALFALDVTSVDGTAYAVGARCGSRRRMSDFLFAMNLSSRSERPFSDYAVLFNEQERGPIVILAVAPVGGRVLTAEQNRRAMVWSVKRGCEEFDLGWPITETLRGGRAAFSADGRRLALVASDGNAIVWDLDDPSRVSTQTVSARGPVGTRKHLEMLFRLKLPVENPIGLWIVNGGIEAVVMDQGGTAASFSLVSEDGIRRWGTGLTDVSSLSDYDSRHDRLLAAD